MDGWMDGWMAAELLESVQYGVVCVTADVGCRLARVVLVFAVDLGIEFISSREASI